MPVTLIIIRLYQFGQVTEGMDIVEKIASVKVVANPYNPSEISRPKISGDQEYYHIKE
jgi:cyclophilin family peptidyl-prolyl cis-trans isomerase